MKRKTSILLFLVMLMSIFCFHPEEAYGQSIGWGAKGELVRQAQQKLKNWGYLEGAVDGVYGEETYRAVRLFQQRNGLEVDGIIGPQTRRALGLPETAATSTAPSRSGVSRSDDVNVLARAIHAEAKGEPYEGKVAVGAVILNRVRHPAFPNTIAGVIYQPCAFEPVKNGSINETPDEESYRAAKDALNGWDPTGGAIYFWNPATSSSPWIWTRKITLRIGKHVFAHD